MGMKSEGQCIQSQVAFKTLSLTRGASHSIARFTSADCQQLRGYWAGAEASHVRSTRITVSVTVTVRTAENHASRRTLTAAKIGSGRPAR